jgi:signal transduction histidine kinase/ligand-binding sensor domain-containing protein
MLRPTLYLLFLFLCQFHAGAAGYIVDSWDTEKGLPDDFVTSIVQTPDGYLWIGTYNGLARFDGLRFVTFKPEDTPQLGHQRIVKLIVDAQGTLWINTFDGSLTTWRNGVFKREWNGMPPGHSEAWLVASNDREIIFSFHPGLLIRRPVAPGGHGNWQILKPPGLPPATIYCQDHLGTVWCSSADAKIWRIQDGRYVPVSNNGGLRGQWINWMAPDHAGNVWIGTDQEVARWDGSLFRDMAPDGEGNLNVASLTFLPDGSVLVAANGRLRKLQDRKWISEWKPWPDMMHQDQSHPTFWQDRDGGMWGVSGSPGLTYYQPDGNSEQIGVADGVPDNPARCLLEDREGNDWIGLVNGGVVRIHRKYFETLHAPGQPAVAAMSVCEDRLGALWVGTYGGGLTRWENGISTNYQISTPRVGDLVFSVFPDASGLLWMSAGMENLVNFADGSLRPAPVAVHAVKCIYVDRQGRVWLGRKDGLDCWSEGKLREWNSDTGSISSPVRSVAEDSRGGIWAGADNGTLYRFENGGYKEYPLPACGAHQAVFSLLPDADGSLWIGTADAGLLHFQDGRFTRFSAKDGLPDDLICQILEDGQGDLWLGTHHGICRVGKRDLQAFAAGKSQSISCSIYGRSDGLPSLECTDMYQPDAWRGHDGKLWFATEKGVVGVQPAQMPVNAQQPPVVIENFLVEGHIQSPPVAKNDLWKVSPGQRNFEFQYTALSLTDADKIQFRYKLEGFDSDWIHADGRRWADYNYLKPGSYRFCVVACNNDGVWNETGAAIELRVLPHFWETWWFLTPIALAIIAAVAAIARSISVRGMQREVQRLAHQRDIEQDRARIARDIHDHIGSGLTRINLLNALLLGDPEEFLPDRVAQITGITCELIGAMDEIVWAVNPSNDTLDSLISYLCDYADEYLRAANIRLRIDLPMSLPAWHLTSEVRHNIFTAVKEIFNNIVKHSHAGEVLLSLRLDGGGAALRISDNGKGFEMNVTPSPDHPYCAGNGLENLRKRASAIGGRFHIRSAPGEGTGIELTIPEPREETARPVRQNSLFWTVHHPPRPGEADTNAKCEMQSAESQK